MVVDEAEGLIGVFSQQPLLACVTVLVKINPEDVFWESEATTGTVSGTLISGN